MANAQPLKKTKIIATIGPACDDDHTMRAMMAAGMNVARLNLSHGTLDEHAERARRLRKVATENGFNLAIMVDTRGREIRTGKLTEGSITLEPGAEFHLYNDDREGNLDGVAVSHKTLHEHVKLRDRILLDDGLIELSVSAVALDSIRNSAGSAPAATGRRTDRTRSTRGVRRCGGRVRRHRAAEEGATDGV